MTVDAPFRCHVTLRNLRAAPGGNSKRWLLTRIDASRVVIDGDWAGGNPALPLLHRRPSS